MSYQFDPSQMSQEELIRLLNAQRQRQEAMHQQPAYGQLQQVLDRMPKFQYNVIIAIDADRGYAKDTSIPWHYPEDFQWFKDTTMGHPCVMGRHTYNEINQKMGEKGKDSVLPGRKCFVVSTTLTSLPNATVIKGLRQIEFHLEDTSKQIFIIGGGKLFLQGAALAKQVYLTIIDKKHDCDKFFPIEYVLERFNVHKYHKSESADLMFMVLNRDENK